MVLFETLTCKAGTKSETVSAVDVLGTQTPSNLSWFSMFLSVLNIRTDRRSEGST